MRRVAHVLSLGAYGIGGLEVGLGAVLLLTSDPKWDPRMLIIAGVCFLVGGKILERMGVRR